MKTPNYMVLDTRDELMFGIAELQNVENFTFYALAALSKFADEFRDDGPNLIEYRYEHRFRPENKGVYLHMERIRLVDVVEEDEPIQKPFDPDDEQYIERGGRKIQPGEITASDAGVHGQPTELEQAPSDTLDTLPRYDFARDAGMEESVDGDYLAYSDVKAMLEGRIERVAMRDIDNFVFPDTFYGGIAAAVYHLQKLRRQNADGRSGTMTSALVWSMVVEELANLLPEGEQTRWLSGIITHKAPGIPVTDSLRSKLEQEGKSG